MNCTNTSIVCILRNKFFSFSITFNQVDAAPFFSFLAFFFFLLMRRNYSSAFTLWTPVYVYVFVRHWKTHYQNRISICQTETVARFSCYYYKLSHEYTFDIFIRIFLLFTFICTEKFEIFLHAVYQIEKNAQLFLTR